MQKVMGILLILISCVVLGMGQSLALSKRLHGLEALLRMTVLIKGELRFAGVSLADAFDGASARMGGACGEFLRSVSQELKEKNGKNFASIFRECAVVHLDGLGLKKEEKRLLFSLGDHLGYLDLEMQMKQLTIYEEELSRLMEELRRELPEKKKVCQSMGILGGILLAILVW